MKIGACACAVAACLLPQLSWCQFAVGDLSILRDYESQRSPSYDPSGGNRDYRSLQAGETLTLLDADGPGEIRHIWVTMPPWHPGAEIYAPQKTVLRAYWDGETQPSVEAPLGNFFGVCVILETSGDGQFAGVMMSIFNNQWGGSNEGDEMIWIEGEKEPRIHGTGGSGLLQRRLGGVGSYTPLPNCFAARRPKPRPRA